MIRLDLAIYDVGTIEIAHLLTKGVNIPDHQDGEDTHADREMRQGQIAK
jgi:hypothetical protein